MRNNIITAVAGDKLYIKTDPVFQYDYGLKLVITGVTLPESYDVHFGNTNSASAKTVTGDSNGVQIPDEYLLNGEDVHAWVYLHTDGLDDDGESVYHIHIPVTDRAAIAEEQITPVEHNVIREALEQIEEAVAETQANVEHYPYISNDGYWMVYDAEHSQFVSTGIKAEGDDGYSPTVAVTEITGGHRVVITDAEGDHTFDVMDGEVEENQLVVHINGTNETTVTADKTLAEIVEAYNAGKTIYGRLAMSGNMDISTDSIGKVMYYAMPGMDYLQIRFDFYAGSDVYMMVLGAPNIRTGEDEWVMAMTTNLSATVAGSSGYYDAQNIVIRNLPNPTQNSDAANKYYVDQAVANVPGVTFHFCVSGEYDAQTGVPTIQNPDTHTFYLVPGGTAPNLYVEWIYANNAWEQFGSATIDISGKADKADTVIDTTLSLNRKANTTVGTNSVALGMGNEASGMFSFSENLQTTASGLGAHAEGISTVASGSGSHAEGTSNSAVGNCAHAEGNYTTASGMRSHTEGWNNTAVADDSHVGGKFSVTDSYSNWPEWVANTSYAVGDKVKVTTTVENTTTVVGYICKTSNNDASFTKSNWNQDTNYNFAEIIGNGIDTNTRSNARTLDWDGNEYLAGDLYVNCNNDSTGGNKVATEAGLSAKADKADTVLDTTLSCGRKANTTVGTGSFAFGKNVEASGSYSHAEGMSRATGNYAHSEGSSSALSNGSHAEGMSCTASGTASHAEGAVTTASAETTHAEGQMSEASANFAHAEGLGSIANCRVMHAQGAFNIGDTPLQEWEANTSYAVGDKVIKGVAKTGYECIEANTDSEWTSAHWKMINNIGLNTEEQTLFVIGNGTDVNHRSNALRVDWYGNERIAGDIYVGCASDSTGGTKLLPGFEINFTSDAQMQSVTSDKTIAEIKAAYQQGHALYGRLHIAEQEYSYDMMAIGKALVMNYNNTNAMVVSFSFPLEADVGVIAVDGIEVPESEDRWQISSITYFFAQNGNEYNAYNAKITNLAAPTANKDAVNKLYVDQAVANKETGLEVVRLI